MNIRCSILSDKKIFLLLSLLIWIYLWLRAFFIPITYDEAATFYHYIHFGRFLPFIAHWDANNHFLNSALSIISYRLLGSSELALRLPNLIFAPLFFYFCLLPVFIYVNSQLISRMYVISGFQVIPYENVLQRYIEALGN